MSPNNNIFPQKKTKKIFPRNNKKIKSDSKDIQEAVQAHFMDESWD